MLSVRDIMQTDLVKVTTDTTARDLARLLTDEQISGLPVLDRNGELAGVVSSTDLVRLAAEHSDVGLTASALRTDDPIRDEDEPKPVADPYGYFLTEDLPFDGRRFLDQLPEGDFDTVLVSEIMTPCRSLSSRRHRYPSCVSSWCADESTGPWSSRKDSSWESSRR